MSSTPSSLHHYTSQEAFGKMLENVLKTKKGEPLMLTLHAGIGDSMNDRAEGKLFLDKFLTDSKLKGNYRNILEDIKKEDGDIFLTSLCRSDRKTKDNGDIPMWSMYGDGGKGLIIVFDYKRLRDFCTKEKTSLQLLACTYPKSNDLSSEITKTNKQFKENPQEELKENLRNLRTKSYTIKSWHWEYEKEYRLITISKKTSFKTGRYGITPYCEVSIPLSCVTKIIVGPLAMYDVVQNNLTQVISRIKEIDSSCDFVVTQSKIQIR